MPTLTEIACILAYRALLNNSTISVNAAANLLGAILEGVTEALDARDLDTSVPFMSFDAIREYLLEHKLASPESEYGQDYAKEIFLAETNHSSMSKEALDTLKTLYNIPISQGVDTRNAPEYTEEERSKYADPCIEVFYALLNTSALSTTTDLEGNPCEYINSADAIVKHAACYIIGKNNSSEEWEDFISQFIPTKEEEEEEHGPQTPL